MSERTPSCATGATSAHPPKVRLGEVVRIDTTIPFPDDAKVWLLNLDMIEQHTGRVIDHVCVEREKLGSSTVAFDQECVLYSKLRPNLNKVVLPDCGGAATSEILPLRCNQTRVTREFACWYLRSPSFVSYAMSKTAGAKMPRLAAKELLNATIPLPPLVEQRQIAAKLDRICEIVTKRKAQLAQLQQLVKSRFVEMFGDPVANEMRWPMVAMNDVLESIGNGRSFVCESFPRIGENPAILKLGAATWGEYRPEENKALKHGDSFFPDCEVKADDLLFTRKNTLELVGKCAYVRATPPKLMLPDLIFRLETNDQIDKVYLASLINCDRFRGEVRKLASGSAGSMPNISKARLLALRIILPPLSLQREFAAFVAKVDRLEAAVKKGLEAAERLYRQQLQEVFDIADNIADNIGDHRTRDHRTRDHRTRDHRTRDNMPQPQLLKEGL